MQPPFRPPGATARQLLLVAAALAAWVVLQLAVLPRLGIST